VSYKSQGLIMKHSPKKISLNPFLIFLVIFGSLVVISTPPMEVYAERGGLLSPGPYQNTYGTKGSFDPSDWEVRSDGVIGPLLSHHPAPLQQNYTWSPLANNGLGTWEVYALAVVGDDLYVGGDFTQTADGAVTNLIDIARYNTITNTWSPLANNGVSGYVGEIAVVGSDLYVGGVFTQTADGAVTNLGNIARYDLTTNTWSALANNGLNDDVYAIALVGTDLYVGGRFSQTADGSVTNLGNIARYDLNTNTWSALANGGLSPGYVNEVAAVGSELYAVGIFTQTADGAVTLNRIARYDTGTNLWSALANNGLAGSTFTMAVLGSDMYVGGAFSGTADGTVTLNRIARYNLSTNTWSALSNNGLDNPVYALAVIGSDLYVGGMWITQTFDSAVTNLISIARYNLSTNNWDPLSNNGLNGGTFSDVVWDLAVVGSDLYAGGDFTQTADGTMTLNRIARYSLMVEPPTVLPETGFHPGVISSLPAQPVEKAYATYGDMRLEIPKLDVELPIVGVPLVKGEWDVSWLGSQAGYLEGTAFPTWPGNTGITAHVWDADNYPGPFAEIKNLLFGDVVNIHAWGHVYTYSVRTNYLVNPDNMQPFLHQEYDWVTLVSCEQYNKHMDAYRFRRVVRAVLVEVSPEGENKPLRR
jgi:LPXTG-site transpeptidase (sortase) family protein